MSFDERVLTDLRTRRDELDAQGKLLSARQLDVFYGTFRERFGPDALLAREGLDLLDYMIPPGFRHAGFAA